MNKLKLGVKSIKDMLSRDELKQIVGGFGGSGWATGSGSNSGQIVCFCNSWYSCNTGLHPLIGDIAIIEACESCCSGKY